MDSKKAVLHLIASLKNFPCLWMVKSPDFMNKIKKLSALEALADEMKEYDGDVTGEEVKKKIASLRACTSIME